MAENKINMNEKNKNGGDYRMTKENCKACNGKGWVHVNTPFGGEKYTCEDCGGKGY